MLQRYRGTEVQRYRGTEVQRYRGSEVQRYRGVNGSLFIDVVDDVRGPINIAPIFHGTFNIYFHPTSAKLK
jgi:hypothetical protein